MDRAQKKQFPSPLTLIGIRNMAASCASRALLRRLIVTDVRFDDEDAARRTASIREPHGSRPSHFLLATVPAVTLRLIASAQADAEMPLQAARCCQKKVVLALALR